jgi:hypothetical protein
VRERVREKLIRAEEIARTMDEALGVKVFGKTAWSIMRLEDFGVDPDTLQPED